MEVMYDGESIELPLPLPSLPHSSTTLLLPPSLLLYTFPSPLLLLHTPLPLPSSLQTSPLPSSYSTPPPPPHLQGWVSEAPPGSLDAQTEHLRDCISVLFMFERKPTRDKSFSEDCRQWLNLLVSQQEIMTQRVMSKFAIKGLVVPLIFF